MKKMPKTKTVRYVIRGKGTSNERREKLSKPIKLYYSKELKRYATIPENETEAPEFILGFNKEFKRWVISYKYEEAFEGGRLAFDSFERKEDAVKAMKIINQCKSEKDYNACMKKKYYK
jgi:hypothetical protein